MESNNTKRQESLSMKLYQYLCAEVVGSENVVKYRRLYYLLVDDIHTTKPLTYISSGSKAEGLDLPGSDMDIMLCANDIPVIDSKRTDIMFDKVFLIMESNNTQPGFVHLVVPPNCCITKSVCFETVYGCLISNREFKEATLSKNMQLNDLHFLHGPCLTTEDGSKDVAFCFRCKTWPHVARSWLSRSRLYNWPSKELIHTISNHGVLLVPIGSKSTGEDNPLEWRISFSEPEKLLIYSFNHTQLLCYSLLKLVLKQVINKDEGVSNLLCSYYMKTVMFWLSEDLEVKIWKPSNLLHCFWNCVQRLLYWIRHNYLPSYFIPQHNMMDGKINERDRRKLELAIQRLKSMGWKFVTHCESLREFLKSDVPKFSRLLSIKSLDYDKVIIEMILKEKLFVFHAFSEEPLSKRVKDISMKCLSRIFYSKQLTRRCKHVYRYYFTYHSLTLALSHYEKSNICILNSDGKKNNKSIYNHYRSVITHLLIGTNIDATYGWIMLAILFYSIEQYYKSVEVLDYISSVLSSENLCTVRPIYLKNIREMKKRYDGYSFCQRLRTEVVRLRIQLLEYETACIFFHDEDLETYTQYGWRLVGSPTILTYFLRFLCYHRLNNFVECIQSQTDLKRSIQDGHLEGNEDLLAVSYLYLAKASAMVGQKETESDSLYKVMSSTATRIEKTANQTSSGCTFKQTERGTLELNTTNK